MPKARLITAALAALVAGASADPGGDLVSVTCPALAAAPLVYVLVPGPLGAGSWAEQEIEAVRLGVVHGAQEEAGSEASELLSASRVPPDYALRMSEAPPDGPARPLVEATRLSAPRPQWQVLGALEALGLTPADLVDAPEIPTAVLALADFLAHVDALLAAKRTGERRAEFVVLDEEFGSERHPGFDEDDRRRKDTGLTARELTLYAKKVTRSVYKALLGVAIGILIWGFVRNSG
jgi:hypothetical protein